MQPDLQELAVELLARTGRGLVIVDVAWALPTWNGLLCSPTPVFKQGRPSCCFTPGCKQDVVVACALAMRHGLRVSARGSGHHYGGLSLLDGAMLIDLRELNSVQVDPRCRTARVGPAATGRQLRAALAPHRLHFTLPHLADVGLSGFILGGGNGWGVRQYGAAADNVTEVEVVLLDGGGGGGEAGFGGAGVTRDGGAEAGCRLVRVRADSDSELFWGLRGAGAFLGIALEFELQLRPAPPALPLIAATYPIAHLPALAAFFRGFHASNPPCIEASMCIVRDGGGGASNGTGAEGGEGTGDGRDDGGRGTGGADGHASTVATARPAVVLACTAFAKPGSPEVEASYSQLRALLPEHRLSLQEGPMPYEQALDILDPAWHWPGLCMYGHGAFLPVDALAPPAAGGSGAANGCDNFDSNGCNSGAVGTSACSGQQRSTTDDQATIGSAAGARVGAVSTSVGPVVTALAEAAASMTSRRSLLLVCPSAPAWTPGRGHAAGDAASSAAGPSDGCGGEAALAGKATTEASEVADAGSSGRGALGFRDTFFVAVYAMWTRSEAGPDADGDAAHVAWARSAAAALAPAALGLYVNEVMHDTAGQVAASYERADFTRLAALKARVDPHGLLRPL